MASNSSCEKLVALLQRDMYSKAHLAVESFRQHRLANILSEADPHPKVEKDEKGKPIVPSREAYAEYFQTMAANYIQDQIRRCEEKWAAASSGASAQDRAERESLRNELEAAKEALKSRTDEGPGLDTVLDAFRDTFMGRRNATPGNVG